MSQERTRAFAMAPPDVGAELNELRRSRLLAVAWLIIGIRIIFSLRSIAIDHRVPPLAGLFGLLIAAGCAVVLFRRIAASRPALELVNMALLLSTILAAGAAYFEVLGSIAGQARGLSEGPQLIRARLDAVQAATWVQTGVAILILVFGLFVPMTAKRALLTLAPIAVAASALPLTIERIDAGVAALGLELSDPANVSITVAFHVATLMTAVYGCAVLGRLRVEAREARRIGSYVLRRRIGGGGMGEVWEAEHALLARPAAVKMISPASLASGQESPETLLRRFENEARATAMLHCPHTVGVFDYGRTLEGGFYYAMEMLEGLNLEDLVRKHGPLSPERTVYILSQVCLSLGEAHSRGLVHRDVKPANISICRIGLQLDYVKVFDFGLVKRKSASDDSLTKVGAMGTPAFIAPEQARGETIDGRTDIYALGCVAFWLLTGRYVFERQNPVQMALDHIDAEPGAPSVKADQEIPTELDDIVLSCLAKKPSERPADALILRDRLRALAFERPWNQARAQEWWRLHHS